MARRWFESFQLPGLWRRLPTTPRATALAQTPAVDLETERGATGTPNYGGWISGEDYNPTLDGKAAVKVYDEMRRSDAQAQAVLLVCKHPVLSADWRVDPPDHGDEVDRAIADAVHAALFEARAGTEPWAYTLEHLLLKLDFGTTVLEKIWTLSDAGVITPKRLAPRLPFTIERWKTDPQTGQLTEIVQWAVKGDQHGEFTIPAAYAVVSPYQREGDNWWGRGLLRAAYMHWWYKQQLYRIDAVRHDRYGVGIPMVTLKQGYSPDKAELGRIDATARAIRSNEKAWIRTVEQVTWSILTPQGGQAGTSGLKESIEHHNYMMSRAILAGFLSQGEQPFGSFGLGEKLADVFASVLEALADGIAHDLTQQVVRDFCDFNFAMGRRLYPQVKALNISDVDAKETTEGLARVNRFITPDDDLENALRKMMNLPTLPPHLARPKVRPPAPPEPPGRPEGPGAGGVPPSGPPVAARRHALRQTWTDPVSGRVLAREPTALEWQVFGVRDVPAWLEMATATLAASLGVLRRAQLTGILDNILAKDAKDTTGTFAAFRPESIALPGVADVERVLREAQGEVMQYGGEQVRAEAARQGYWPLARQGAVPAAAALDALATAAGERPLAWRLDQAAVGLQRPVPRPDASERIAQRGLTASAKITAEGLSDAWYRRILERALGVRKTGVEGEALREAVYADLFDQADAVRGEARAQVNEAFGLGRAVEAYSLRDEIDLVEYSALMDTETCDACAALDGERFAWGSDRYYETFPPYQHCEGAKGRTNACRCVHLFLFQGRTV